MVALQFMNHEPAEIHHELIFVSWFGPIPKLEGYQGQGCLSCEATCVELSQLLSFPGVFTVAVQVPGEDIFTHPAIWQETD